MRLRKNTAKFIVLITLVCFLGNCIGYNRVVVKPGDPFPVDKKVVIHWRNYSYLLSDVSIKNQILEGTVTDQNWKKLSKSKIIHAYIEKSLDTPLENQARCSIPVTEFDRIETYNVSTGKTILKVSGGILAGMAALVIIVLATKESCPFVYTYDGTEFKFEGEIYSGAIYPSLERHDYLSLPDLHSSNNEYYIKLTNEVKEIQYTNLAELLVIDHEADNEVLIDRYGVIHSLSQIQQPQNARSLNGEDVFDLIAKKDDKSYVGNIERQGDKLMDGMVLNFTKPAGTDSARLVIHAKNSPWLDYVFGQFDNLFGDLHDQWQDMQKSAPVAKMEKWEQDQGIPLSAYIEKNGEWQFVDYFNVAGPMALKDDVLELDISEIQSDEIRVKLEYGFAFWEIDYVAMDFSSDVLFYEQTVTVTSAVDQDDEDVSGLLLEDDDQYQVLAEVGHQVSLKFPVPQADPTMKRSIFLHSKGHYEAIRSPKGMPDINFLNSFRQPGRFIEFSNEQLRKLVDAGRN